MSVTTMPWRRPQADSQIGLDSPTAELLAASADQLSSGRADCCIARAAFRVVLPANAGRSQTAELRLCGHHYRRSAAALRRLDAAVFDAGSRLVGSAAHS